jgi:hypothetical protein
MILPAMRVFFPAIFSLLVALPPGTYGGLDRVLYHAARTCTRAAATWPGSPGTPHPLRYRAWNETTFISPDASVPDLSPDSVAAMGMTLPAAILPHLPSCLARTPRFAHELPSDVRRALELLRE